MFHLHYDTHLEHLADRLAGLLARREAADLLRPQTVLVPQKGLERWLIQRLAERHGIAANLEFLMPAQMVWWVLRSLHEDLPVHSAFGREVLRWRLLDLLAHPPADAPQLATLVEGEPAALRRFQLAGHLAQLFERYQGYRLDLLRDWERGADPDDAQAVLWRALVDGSNERPRSHLLGEFLQHHAGDAGAPLPDLPSRLFAFGCINVSPDVLRFLGVLGRHAEMHFFLPTPCREYWGDIPSRHDWRARLCEVGGGYFDEPANPLLVSMGGVGRDFVAQVFGYDEVQPDVETEAEEGAPPRDTLLHRVQADVITLAAPPAHRAGSDPGSKPEPELEPGSESESGSESEVDSESAATSEIRATPDPDDVSLRVHVCHSPLREVQVLHDQLLDLFERDPALEPRDVAVMVPNLATYAPCVDAVFGALAPGDPRHVPWTVADRPAASAHAVTGMFLRLLALPATRLSLDDVLDVLAVPAVARAQGLDGAELEALRAQLAAAGVRWGEDERDRVARGLPAWREFSWAFGRERLLLGYLLGDDETPDALVDGIAPLTDIEGRAAQVLGQALDVQRLLRRLRDEQRHEHTAADWQQRLNRVLDALLPDSDQRDEQRALETIRTALAALADGAETAGCEQALDWMCVRDFLTERLADPSAHQHFLAGGVSVCGLVPLRNVPFKVICVLGLDSTAFPRRDPGDALSRIHDDLLHDRRRLGDRSVREDDRYLFLQTLMAAYDTLYLSYTGINARDGSAIEPSIVLEELLDTVCDGYFSDPGAARKALVVRHALQPFAPGAPVDDAAAPAFTFRHEWQVTGETSHADAEPSAFADALLDAGNDTDTAVELVELQAFLGAPQRYFLQQRAGLAMPSVEGDEFDREPLVDDSRTRAMREQSLFESLCRDAQSDRAAAFRHLRAQAQLPPLALGEATFADTWDQVHPQAALWRQHIGGGEQAGESFQLDLPSGRRLTGQLPALTANGGCARWVGSDANARRWVGWWVELLALVAVKGHGEAFAFGHGGRRVALPCRLALPAAEAAKLLLDELLDVRAQGLREPLALPLRAAWVYAAEWADDDKAQAKALKAATDVWEGGERDDPWIALALRGRDPLFGAAGTQAFEDLALSVFGPLWQAIREGDPA